MFYTLDCYLYDMFYLSARLHCVFGDISETFIQIYSLYVKFVWNISLVIYSMYFSFNT